MPSSRRIFRTVLAETFTTSLRISLAIRWSPERGFSRAKPSTDSRITADRRSSDPAGVRPAASDELSMPAKQRRRDH
jgi:hypothetical protein